MTSYYYPLVGEAYDLNRPMTLEQVQQDAYELELTTEFDGDGLIMATDSLGNVAGYYASGELLRMEGDDMLETFDRFSDDYQDSAQYDAWESRCGR